MRKRTFDGTVVQKPSRKDNKKVCDLGRTCPYQEEYQHLMEFSHNCAPAPRAPARGQFNAFTGQGVRLGAAGGENYYAPVARPTQHSSSWEDAIRCEFCSQKIAINMIEAHLATHDGNAKILKRDQDSEYEQSVIEDIQRRSEEEAQRCREVQAQLEAKEAAELEEVLQKSILASNKGINWR